MFGSGHVLHPPMADRMVGAGIVAVANAEVCAAAAGRPGSAAAAQNVKVTGSPRCRTWSTDG